MFDPIGNFFTRVFQSIGRGIGFGVSVVLWPFMWARHWYANRGWILRSVVGAIVVLILGLYGYFIWNTQRWLNFNPDYVGAYDLTAQRGSTKSAGGTRERHNQRAARSGERGAIL